MQVGDRVILSAVGMERYMDEPVNPHNTLGVIGSPERILFEGFKFYVEWSNGYTNAYRSGELQVIQC